MEELLREQLSERLSKEGRTLLNKNSVLYKKVVSIVKLRRVCVVLLVTGIFFLLSGVLFGGFIDVGLSAKMCNNVKFWLQISAMIIAAVISVTVSIIPVSSCTTVQLESKLLPGSVNALGAIIFMVQIVFKFLNIDNHIPSVMNSDDTSSFSPSMFFGKNYIMEYIFFFIYMSVGSTTVSQIKALQNKFAVKENGEYSGGYKDLLGEIADCKTVREQNEVIFHGNPKFAASNAPYSAVWAYANRVNLSSVAATIVAFGIAMMIILIPIFGTPVSLVKAEKIGIGMSLSAVEDILGEPDGKESGEYLWVDNGYKKLSDRHIKIENEMAKLLSENGSADKMEKLFEDLMKLEEEMQKTVFSYIIISMQGEKVYRVVFDTHGNDNTKKDLKNIVLSRNEISRDENGAWQTVYARVYFTDGSYTLSAIPYVAFDSIKESDTEVTLEWTDEFGSYSKSVRIKK